MVCRGNSFIVVLGESSQKVPNCPLVTYLVSPPPSSRFGRDAHVIYTIRSITEGKENKFVKCIECDGLETWIDGENVVFSFIDQFVSEVRKVNVSHLY
jgi:hypothetical protein